MPPICCQCNHDSGSCKNCSYKKGNKRCRNYLPHWQGCCANQQDQHLFLPCDTDLMLMCPASSPLTLHTSSIEDEVGPIITPDTPKNLKNLKSTCKSTLTPAILTTSISDQSVSDLPLFASVPPPNFQRGDLDGGTFAIFVNQCYEEIVHWRRNL